MSRTGKQIVILCEGDTEEFAVKLFIRRQWEAQDDKDAKPPKPVGYLKPIGFKTVNLDAHLEDIFKFVPEYRKNQKVLAVFTLIDLYGTEQVKHGAKDDLAQKVENVKKWLRDGCGEDGEGFFYPHVSVHDLEAWLLAEGEALSQRLQKRIDPDKNAEKRNFQTPPSKRINAIFRQHRGEGYRKTIDGKALFERLKFHPVYDTCDFFRAFYDELRRVGQAALDG